MEEDGGVERGLLFLESLLRFQFSVWAALERRGHVLRLANAHSNTTATPPPPPSPPPPPPPPPSSSLQPSTQLASLDSALALARRVREKGSGKRRPSGEMAPPSSSTPQRTEPKRDPKPSPSVRPSPPPPPPSPAPSLPVSLPAEVSHLLYKYSRRIPSQRRHQTRVSAVHPLAPHIVFRARLHALQRSIDAVSEVLSRYDRDVPSDSKGILLFRAWCVGRYVEAAQTDLAEHIASLPSHGRPSALVHRDHCLESLFREEEKEKETIQSPVSPGEAFVWLPALERTRAVRQQLLRHQTPAGVGVSYAALADLLSLTHLRHIYQVNAVRGIVEAECGRNLLPLLEKQLGDDTTVPWLVSLLRMTQFLLHFSTSTSFLPHGQDSRE